jgi:hypothetical protein
MKQITSTLAFSLSVGACFVGLSLSSSPSLAAGDPHSGSVVEAEQRRLHNERISLEQKQRFETEQSRLYQDRAVRQEQQRFAIDRPRDASLRDATQRQISTSNRENERFMRFFDLAKPALQRDDFDAVKLAAVEMRVTTEDEFTRDYYDRLRRLLPDANQ